MMKITFHSMATKEFAAKYRWLERSGFQPDSAARFYGEIQRAAESIELLTYHRPSVETPEFFRVGPTDIFSFSLIYRLVDDTIYVVAIAAPERKPGYWKGRRF